MPSPLSKCWRIRHIVRLRQLLRRWRSKAAATAWRIPADVPAGHVAVCVGSSSKRFVVRATHLNHSLFRSLLVQAEEEYGFGHHGPLCIPCDESVFGDILRSLSRPDSARRCLREGSISLDDSLPLLLDKSLSLSW